MANIKSFESFGENKNSIKENNESCPDCGGNIYYEDVLGVNKCTECEWNEGADAPANEELELINKIYDISDLKHYHYPEDMKSALIEIKELIDEYKSR